MSLAADLMIVIGAVLLTFGTDLVITTAGLRAPVGQILGILVSVLGTMVLTSGILINRRRARREAQPPPAPPGKLRALHGFKTPFLTFPRNKMRGKGQTGYGPAIG